ncbi:hypothetical protein Geob_2702 [Geotalea daltonii FRC-32]|uniref:Uncharacterized protein n=1 Tax=Geotalea daltonii (strain DSM 22248 / JCM 15807 / FRC-32) TaxID=316067 RepID=B9M1H0_GEODF|nr:hypothetical protein [Geotalea daltonii]ACM21052.1 hypothetical protein Geob_2702 [Geotalea daltonii FRC-32]
MRKRTVRLGLNYILVAMVLITIATFFHEELAWLFMLSPVGETELALTGLVVGWMFGGVGVVIAAVGFLQSATREADVQLRPIIIVLAAVLAIFMMLFYTSLIKPEEPRLRPGETITI